MRLREHFQKLNLACGGDFRDDYWNVDAGPFRADEHVDVFAALPWADCAFDEVLASDILEHTAWAHTEQILTEWIRVIAPGGKIVIRVPDLRTLASSYLSGAFDLKTAGMMIYGGQELGIGKEHWRLNAHYAAFDHNRLLELCAQQGLLVAALDSSFTNLVLTAVKPGTKSDSNCLVSGQCLQRGEAVYSRTGEYILTMQRDGTLSLYRHRNGLLWAKKSGDRLVLQPDGNCVLYQDMNAVWSTVTCGTSTALFVQDDGNLVLYSENRALWSSQN